ncbi:uncharacterized protein TNIN_375451 [Trichonephila inaurata madagascariensis]|uniref:Uncharacterized protein n=1 Tax=Trichonephila inaurata madagascariensis TaxID=2747483 RepID=A0A8X7BQH4_9ARAC|nr:uncharacterized protein TNIN_375451 [Trichonephila inaurata madagascariensis]
MSPTQVRTISEYGVWIVVSCADINRFEKDMKKMSIDNFSKDYEKKKVQRFICNVYNADNVIDVDAARLQMFIDLYAISDVNEAFDRKKLRNFYASNLPPCKSELLQQFLRANYTCTIWNNAHLKNPATYQPENNGWAFENDKYHFKWFEGDQLPSNVSDSLKTQSSM